MKAQSLHHADLQLVHDFYSETLAPLLPLEDLEYFVQLDFPLLDLGRQVHADHADVVRVEFQNWIFKEKSSEVRSGRVEFLAFEFKFLQANVGNELNNLNDQILRVFWLPKVVIEILKGIELDLYLAPLSIFEH